MTNSFLHIGYRVSANNLDVKTASESSVLRSLFDLRKSYSAQSERLPTITDLSFWKCQWTPRIVASLRKLFVRDGRRFSSIKFLDCDTDGSQEFAEILLMILTNDSTKSLVIRGRRCNRDRTQSTNRGMVPRRFCNRSFSRSVPIMDKHIQSSLAEGFSKNTTLISIKFSGLKFEARSDKTSVLENDGTHWLQHITTHKSLRHLDFSGSTLPNSMVNILSQVLSLNKSFQSLNLNRCYLNDHAVSQLLLSIKDHPNLRKLNLSKNCIGVTSADGIEGVTKLLESKINKLEYLDLSNQCRYNQLLHEEMDQSTFAASSHQQGEVAMKTKMELERCLNALSTNTTIETINLSHNKGCFADLSTIKILSDCLIKNESLKHVNVSSCGVTSEGIRSMSRHFRLNCGKPGIPSDRSTSLCLKSLILFDSDYVRRFEAGRDGRRDQICALTASDDFATLERALRTNLTLEDVGTLPHSNENATRLQHLLNMNRAGRRALQQGQETNELPIAAWSHILARTDFLHFQHSDDCGVNGEETKVSALFELLREGPTLFIR